MNRKNRKGGEGREGKGGEGRGGEGRGGKGVRRKDMKETGERREESGGDRKSVV